MEINAVEEGTGDFCSVFETLGGPDAIGFGIAFESAWAGVHRTDEHASGGEGEGGLNPGDGDDGIFEGLAQGFEDIASEFGHFVEKEDAVVSEGDFTGLRGFASADNCGVTGGVVGGTEGTTPDKAVGIAWFAC